MIIRIRGSEMKIEISESDPEYGSHKIDEIKDLSTINLSYPVFSLLIKRLGIIYISEIIRFDEYFH
jgi:hypothetical protein